MGYKTVKFEVGANENFSGCEAMKRYASITPGVTLEKDLYGVNILRIDGKAYRFSDMSHSGTRMLLYLAEVSWL